MGGDMSRRERTVLKHAENEEGCEDDDDGDDGVVAYLTLPDHPGPGSVAVTKTLRLRDLVGDYTGPDLYFDFDASNVLLGVEILD